MKKVLLSAMPFISIRYPAIGISLLKARLSRERIPCEIRYFNLDFARMIGPEKLDIYEEICFYSGKMLMGEWLFAQEYFGDQLPREQEYAQYLREISPGQRDSGDYFDKFLGMKPFIKPFLDRCLESISWEDFSVIGFSTMFEQNLASIALARRIKLLDPAKIIVFGGPNCESEMGVELHRRFPFIDYICSGEADDSFPEFVKRLRDQKTVQDIPGIIYRRGGESILTEGSQAIKNLDSLPHPDYDDYFAQLKPDSSPSWQCYQLPMETSRGCWWGEKSQCKFCGLNGVSLRFRSKTKDRVLAELDDLLEKNVKKYNLPLVSVVDNILDMKYFQDLLPEIKERQFPLQLFYETKSNLDKEQVRKLYEAGVTWIQPGVESLNTHVLKLMGKGVSALQNIQLLKYCKQFEIYPTWNILTHFPGEKEADYQEMVNLIYKITHLPPPGSNFSFVLERFSPYYLKPEEYGLVNRRPDKAYRFIYPFAMDRLFDLAYYFEFDYRKEVKPPDFDEELSAAVNYWQECYERNEFLRAVTDSGDRLVIEDGRSNAVIRRIILRSVQKDIYEFCDQVRTLSSIFSYIREKYSHSSFRLRDVKDFLEEMVSLNFMAREEEKYLSLAVPVARKPSMGYIPRSAQAFL